MFKLAGSVLFLVFCRFVIALIKTTGLLGGLGAARTPDLVFPNKPAIISAASATLEAKGPLAEDFDLLHKDLWLGRDSYKKQKKMLEKLVKQPSKGRLQTGRSVS